MSWTSESLPASGFCRWAPAAAVRPTSPPCLTACLPHSLCLRSQQVVTFVHERLEKGVAPTEICSELLNACLAHDPREARGIGCDNMTAAIILIDDEARKRGAAAAEAASTPTPTLTEKSPTKHMA